ncbi:MAG: Na+/H+ antiporter NhaA [Acidobacteriota bacterium]|jgi:NhaA family Na+:H+ antiporter|nr:Na+/H+ antiporter NhaA [Acidobacteriota bacterium]
MIQKIKLTKSFGEFFDGEKSAGIMLMVCSVASLLIANGAYGENYLNFWQTYVGGLTVSYWINDGLMAIFFLFIGLELERELYKGELSNLRNALLPIFAALGGIALPALIHFNFNSGLPTQNGFGIPMATDIAFALSILALVGSRIPASLKIFLTAVAVIDDLCAIIVIAVFYTAKLSIIYLASSIFVFIILIVLNRLKIISLIPYLIGGVLMWFLMLQSGVHATIAGVLLAFTIPFTPKTDDENSPSYIFEHFLHKPVAFFIMPVFALANTGIIIGSDWFSSLSTPNSLGIMTGLLFGKVIGITVLSFIAVKLDICRLPIGLKWSHILGAGFLAGVGFTMSIFITNLAFKTSPELINSSKISILLASIISGVVGYLWLVSLDIISKDSDIIDTLSYDDED